MPSAVSLFGLLDAPAVEAGTAATSMAYVAALPELVTAGPAEETAAAAPAEEAAKITADAAPEALAAAQDFCEGYKILFKTMVPYLNAMGALEENKIPYLAIKDIAPRIAAMAKE